MSHVLIVGKNTYSTEAESSAYLETRLRSMTAWAALTSAQRCAALSSAFYLLETLWAWKGTKTGVTQLSAFTIVSSGLGYAVGEIVTVVGGTGEAAQAKVTTIGALGIVTGLQLIHTGFYSASPTGTLTTTASLSGTGLTVTGAAYATQLTDWPRTGTGVSGVTDTAIPDGIKSGQCQLAFELTQDADLETASNANQNTRSMAVGSLRIEYFRAEFRNRFPTIVWGLISEFVGGDSSSAAQAFGGDGESSFEEQEPFGISGGGY